MTAEPTGPVSPTSAVRESAGSPAGSLTGRRRDLVLFLAGANLTLVQFVAMREFAALVGSNELVVLLVVGGYFLGLSSGYLVAERLSRRALIGLGVATLALHATLPFSARWFSGTMAAVNLAGNTPPFLFLLTLFGLTPFYAVFLPRLIAEPDGPGAAADSGTEPTPHARLVHCYATELAGGLAGLVAVLLIGPERMGWISALHLAGLVTLLGLLARMPAPLRWLLPGLPLLYLLVWPVLDRASLEFHYRETQRLSSARLLASEFSPYQRVDLVVTQPRGTRQLATNLYLNGNLLYGSRALHEHNLMVSVVPNLLTPGGGGNALVIAGGSLDNARYLAPRTRRLHVVEIDETVVRLARQHLQAPRGGFPENWTLVIDDGKHFLGGWSGEPFDTICVDVPVPSHLQTAMLHSERFFALARSRLKPGGIFSISLGGRLDDRPEGSPPSPDVSARILAGLVRQFPHVTVGRLSARDFAWASHRPVVENAASLHRRISAFCGEPTGAHARFHNPRPSLLADADLRRRVRDVAPIGEADMQVVMQLSLNKLKRRFYHPD